jgi:DNA (cytosine-5)-methyltransferase 1
MGNALVVGLIERMGKRISEIEKENIDGNQVELDLVFSDTDSQ